MLKIILDCDDVLYQTNEAALERLNEELGTSYGLEDITKWGTISRELDCRLEYFQDPEFIWGLPVYDGASEFIASIRKSWRNLQTISQRAHMSLHIMSYAIHRMSAMKTCQ